MPARVKKGKKGRKAVNEYELRRKLREQTRPPAVLEEAPMTHVVLPEIPEDIRIGGIEGYFAGALVSATVERHCLTICSGYNCALIYLKDVEVHETSATKKSTRDRDPKKSLNNVNNTFSGSTHSTLVIIDGKGTVLTEVSGPSTNHWAYGIDETVARINAMVVRGKQNINMHDSIPLHCLGLSLSGCEIESTNRIILKTIQEKYPNVAQDYFISSDTLGSLRTALPNGGIVLIAGTGSNALLINADGATVGCGGWGHFIGDEGAAFWMAHRACKYVFDDIDGLVPAPKPISYIWPAMRLYFNVIEPMDMLPNFYSDFNKSTFAKFTKEIVTGCEKRDPLCLHIFKESGKNLAKHVVALARKAHNDLKLEHGGLKVICVGSVWKSWDYMKDAFVEEIHDSHALDEFSLIRLTVSSGLGACYLAAEKVNWLFTKHYEKNIEVFYHYKRDNYIKPAPIVEQVYVTCDTANKN